MLKIAHMVILAIVICGLLLPGCGGSAYVNKSYKYESNNEPILAIIPPRINHKIVDDAFNKSFSKNSKIKKLIFPSELRDKSIDVIEQLERAKQADTNKVNNLKSILSTKQYEKFTAAIKPANIVLIPYDFQIKESLGRTFGNFEFYLYDVASGVLIYKNSHSYNVDVQGEKAFFLLSNIATNVMVDEINISFPK
jgi:hypothetical protein